MLSLPLSLLFMTWQNSLLSLICGHSKQLPNLWLLLTSFCSCFLENIREYWLIFFFFARTWEERPALAGCWTCSATQCFLSLTALSRLAAGNVTALISESPEVPVGFVQNHYSFSATYSFSVTKTQWDLSCVCCVTVHFYSAPSGLPPFAPQYVMWAPCSGS